MNLEIHLSQAQHHALSIRHPQPEKTIEAIAKRIADELMQELYKEELYKAERDPAYKLMPDIEAAILAMPLPDGHRSDVQDTDFESIDLEYPEIPSIASSDDV